MSTTSTPAEAVEAAASPSDEEAAPRGRVVLIDLGKKSRKKVRRLRRGEGKLMATVEEQVEALREHGEIGEDNDVVIVVVEREQKDLLRQLGLT